MNYILSLFGYNNICSQNQEVFLKKFGENAEASRVYQEYFSSYSKGLLPLDSGAVNLIEETTHRKIFLQRVSKEWEKSLFPSGPAGSTHFLIPSEERLRSAITSQFIFEEELVRLKEIDQLRRAKLERVAKEIDLLQRAQGFRYYFLSGKDAEYIAQIEKGAKAKGVPLLQELDQRIQRKKELMERIGFHLKRERFSQLPIDTLPTSLPKPMSSKLHRSIKNHGVVILGDPILEKDASICILKRGAGLKDAEWGHFLSQDYAETLETALKNQTPFEELYRGVEVSREPVSAVLNAHMGRDAGFKTRREVLEDGRSQRTNSLAEPSWWLSRIWSGGWSKRREATAGADYHEALLINRKLVQLVLSGKIQEVPHRIIQNLGEYFEGLLNNDVAKLSGSYAKDPNFLQAIGLHRFVQDQARSLYEKRAKVAVLQEALETPYVFVSESAKLQQLVQDCFESYENWRRNLREYLDQMTPAIKEALGPDLLGQLNQFYQILETFLQNAPPLEIRQVIADRRAILDRKGPSQELDAVWTLWKQNKTERDIEQILRESIQKVEQSVREFSLGFVVIAAPLSNPSFQIKVKEVSSPALSSAFDHAIPPFYQNKAKTELFMKEILKGTDTSPLWLSEVDTTGIARAELVKGEFLRSRQGKLNL